MCRPVAVFYNTAKLIGTLLYGLYDCITPKVYGWMLNNYTHTNVKHIMNTAYILLPVYIKMQHT